MKHALHALLAVLVLALVVVGAQALVDSARRERAASDGPVQATVYDWQSLARTGGSGMDAVRSPESPYGGWRKVAPLPPTPLEPAPPSWPWPRTISSTSSTRTIYGPAAPASPVSMEAPK